MKKSILAGLLSVVLCMGLLGVPVAAEETESELAVEIYEEEAESELALESGEEETENELIIETFDEEKEYLTSGYETEETTYTLHYCLDGCTTGPEDEEYSALEQLGYVSETLPERFGYNFRGWGTSKTSDTVSYLPGDAIHMINDLTLYPVWEEPMVIHDVD